MRGVAIASMILAAGLAPVGRAVEFAGGTGEPNDPYQIATAEQLIGISSDPNLLDKHFVLVNDIDLDPNLPGGRVFDEAIIAPDANLLEYGFQGPAFTGRFDGRGRVIRNLTIAAVERYTGLFGHIGLGGRVENIGLPDVSVTTTIPGWRGDGLPTTSIGILAASNGGIVSGSYCTGRVAGFSAFVANNAGFVRYCYVRLGGSGLGGLVGGRSNGLISQCYVVSSHDDLIPGSGLPAGNLWSIGGSNAPLTDLQMMRRETFAGWDFYGTDADGSRDMWFMPEGDYPVLAWQTEITGLVLPPRVARKSSEELWAAIEDAGLVPGVLRYDYDSFVPKGDVLALSVGCAAARGTPVDIVLSAGPYDWRINPGDGTILHPYEISTPGQLDSLTQSPELWDRCFVLTANLDLSSRTYSGPLIAPDMNGRLWEFDGIPFTGTFDGAGHVIVGLTIETDQDFAGLFGKIDKTGEIRNLGLRAALVMHSASVVGGPWRISGALAAENWGIITECFSSGVVASGSTMGGLIGHNAGVISNCYSTAETPGYAFHPPGGITGRNSGTVTNCYTANSQGRGVMGDYGGYYDLWNCFYLGSSPTTAPWSGTVLTDDQMRRQDSFVGWDFHGSRTDGMRDVWFMPDGEYPVLAWQTELTGMAWVSQCGGMSLEERRTSLLSQGLMPGEIFYDYADDIPAGWVIGTIPSGAIPLGSAADLLVSAGPYDWSTNPGEGTPDNPYEIEAAGQLLSLANHPELYSRLFVLTADIDMRGRVLRTAAIAPDVNLVTAGYQGTRFSGVLDGGGRRIIGLAIRGGYAASCLGLFGGMDSKATVKNLTIEGADVSGGSNSLHMGILAGFSCGSVSNCRMNGVVIAGGESSVIGGFVGENSGLLVDCHAVGSVTGGHASTYIGGLTGRNRSSIARCSADCTTTAMNYSECIGGLSGVSTGRISACYSTGFVSGYKSVGGLIGESYQEAADSYSAASVTGSLRVGGLVGSLVARQPMPRFLSPEAQEAEAAGQIRAPGMVAPSQGKIVRCYAAGLVHGDTSRGLVGVSSNGTVTNSYWDVEASGVQTSAGGTPRTTEEMRQQTGFVGWDFENVWTICEGRDYPRLRWEGVECDDGF